MDSSHEGSGIVLKVSLNCCRSQMESLIFLKLRSTAVQLFLNVLKRLIERLEEASNFFFHLLHEPCKRTLVPEREKDRGKSLWPHFQRCGIPLEPPFERNEAGRRSGDLSQKHEAGKVRLRLHAALSFFAVKTWRALGRRVQ